MPKRKPGRGRRPERAPAPAPLPIVYEDQDFIVCDKPPGMLSVTPPGRKDESLFRALQERGGPRDRARRERRVWVIHRLDREASGLLVFAKTEPAFRWLKEDFRARRVERKYLALAEGVVPPPPPGSDGVLQSFLREDRFGLVRSVRVERAGPLAPGPESDEAKMAVTYYRVAASGTGHTLVELRMESGRKHQIRVHLSELGHPISGDERYGARGSAAGRLALHACLLSFRHPADGRLLRFESPAPDSWWRLADAQPPAPPASKPAAPPPRQARARTLLDTSWDRVSGWYEQLQDDGRQDHFERLILPGTLRLLDARPGERMLDLACGGGHLAAALADLGVKVVGVDASERLVDYARSRVPAAEFFVADARDLSPVPCPPLDAATCILALMNIDPLDPVFRGLARRLKQNGRFVGVILHPAFRAPRQTTWGFTTEDGRHRQHRKVSGYLSPGQYEIVMNPGEVARGSRAVKTWTFHRPLQHYVKLLSDAGFMIDAIEEWPSLRTSEGGPRADEENRARREIPLFLAFRAVLSRPGPGPG